MQSAMLRLALAQFVAIFYSILVIGVLLKVRFGSPVPAIFATFLRDFGVLLLVLPAAWLLWAAVAGHRPRVDSGEAGSILLSGVVVLVCLGLLALAGTISVLAYPYPLIQAKGHPTSNSP